MPRKSAGKLLSLAAAGLTVAAMGCGKKAADKSDSVTIDIEPPEPIVITADTSKFSAPWFTFKVKISNGADAILNLVAVSFEVSITDRNGNTLSGSGAFSPSDLDDEVSTEDAACTFEEFDEYNPEDSFYLQSTNTSTDADCPTDPIEITFAPEGLPSSDNLSAYRYKIKLTPEGWFINDDGTLERFTRFKQFFTK